MEKLFLEMKYLPANASVYVRLGNVLIGIIITVKGCQCPIHAKLLREVGPKELNSGRLSHGPH